MSLRVIEIQKELDVNNQDTEYGSQKWALEATRKDSLSNVDEKSKRNVSLWKMIMRQDAMHFATQPLQQQRMILMHGISVHMMTR